MKTPSDALDESPRYLKVGNHRLAVEKVRHFETKIKHTILFVAEMRVTKSDTMTIDTRIGYSLALDNHVMRYQLNGFVAATRSLLVSDLADRARKRYFTGEGVDSEVVVLDRVFVDVHSYYSKEKEKTGIVHLFSRLPFDYAPEPADFQP